MNLNCRTASLYRYASLIRQNSECDEVGKFCSLTLHRDLVKGGVSCVQSVSGPVLSGAIKTMRQSTYLVLLTLQKTTSDNL